MYEIFGQSLSIPIKQIRNSASDYDEAILNKFNTFYFFCKDERDINNLFTKKQVFYKCA